MSESLYDRLGGTEGITQIASDVVDNHLVNSRITARFTNSDIPKLKHSAATFFITSTGGPDVYEGADMTEVHARMNIDVDEFAAVLDDTLAALQKNDIGRREQEEVLYVLYSLKPAIVRQ